MNPITWKREKNFSEPLREFEAVSQWPRSPQPCSHDHVWLIRELSLFEICLSCPFRQSAPSQLASLCAPSAIRNMRVPNIFLAGVPAGENFTGTDTHPERVRTLLYRVVGFLWPKVQKANVCYRLRIKTMDLSYEPAKTPENFIPLGSCASGTKGVCGSEIPKPRLRGCASPSSG
jgi:hypothetical protein